MSEKEILEDVVSEDQQQQVEPIQNPGVLMPVIEHYVSTFHTVKSIHEFIEKQLDESEKGLVLENPTLVKEKYVGILNMIDETLLGMAHECIFRIGDIENRTYAAINFYEDEGLENKIGIELFLSNDKLDEEIPSHKAVKNLYETLTNQLNEKEDVDE